MDDRPEVPFYAALETELQDITFRRDQFPAAPFPFLDKQAEKRAWRAAQALAKRTATAKGRDWAALPEEEKYRLKEEAWLKTWEPAVQACLTPWQQALAGAKDLLALCRGQVSDEEERALERQKEHWEARVKPLEQELKEQRQGKHAAARWEADEARLLRVGLGRRRRRLGKAALNRAEGALERKEEAALGRGREAAADLELVGLAFSGGGIRSATFNLGVLQGLADLGLLRWVDYLSTVSGGGYIGGWLTAWANRAGGLASVERQLQTDARGRAGGPAPAGPVEPPPLRHLRRHSNYLAPRQGYLSADVWVLWAIYLRNFLLNQLVLLPAAVVVLLLSRLLMFFYYPSNPGHQLPTGPPETLSSRWFASIAVLVGLCAFIALTSAFGAAGFVRPRRTAGGLGKGGGQPGARDPGWLFGMFVVPLLLSAAFFCYLAPYPLPICEAWGYLWPKGYEVLAFAAFGLLLSCLSGLLTVADQRVLYRPAGWEWVVLVAFATLCGALAGVGLHGAYRLFVPRSPDAPLGMEIAIFLVLGVAVSYFVCAVAFCGALSAGRRAAAGPPAGAGRMRAWALVTVAAGTGLVGGLLLYGVYWFLNWLYGWDGEGPWAYIQARATAAVTAFGPPLFLLAAVLAVYLVVLLTKWWVSEELREWWGSLSGRLLAAAAIWAAVNVVALYGTAIVLWAAPWGRAALASGWLLTVAGGVLAGGGRQTEATRPKKSYREWFAQVAFHVFVAGILILVSLLVHATLDKRPRYEEAADDAYPTRQEPERPPTRVTETEMTSNARPVDTHLERRQQRESVRVPNEAATVAQSYWMGILNTEAHFIPRVKYALGPHYHDDLKADGLSDLALRQLRLLKESQERNDKGKNLSRREFQDRLDEFLGRPLDGEESQGNADELRRYRAELPHYKAAALAYAKMVEPIGYKPEELAGKFWAWLGGCALVLLVTLFFVDVNLFSLHAVYGNRLTRCYLGASRALAAAGGPRDPDPVTGFDPDDDLRLADLQAPGHEGPYLLVNAALNLVRGRELAWQERKAQAFVFTPRYCGSETTGYRPTAGGHDADEGYAGGVWLGTAVTISGAAASPNMGYHSSPAVTFLLTVFNARLGAWLGNPNDPCRWRRRGPRLGFWHLFRELFGWTDDKSGYVYLSDGGHFENLGVYELVRRRCRFVIACDAGCDEEHGFEDLGNLIRKVRIDFGIRIEVPLDSLRRQGEPRRCRWHCVVGKIHYEDVDRHAMPGTLVYLKPSLTGDEPADVLDYASRNPTFPHETTGNQFYSESQFESYRALGHHIARAVFEQPAADMEAEAPGPERRPRCRVLFASVVRLWFAMPPEFEAAFVQATHGFIDVQKAFRRDERLWRLTFDLYPELNPGQQELDRRARAETEGERADRLRAEAHVITQMLQVMENAWLSLNLDVHYAHPHNRGWMDVFHRWTSAGTVRRHWATLRGEFGRGFVSFCEKQMQLGLIKGKPVLLKTRRLTEQQRRRLCLEFADQWPEERGLEERLREAELNKDSWAWLVYSTTNYPGQTAARHGEMPCGVIHLARAADRAYDFFVWMRGAYRNTGLGRPAVRDVLEHVPEIVGLDKIAGRTCRLRVRLPVKGLTGPGGEVQKSMWLTFFHHHDFRRVSPAGADNGNPQEAEIVLEREFRG